jgi:hypothetical protein
MTETPLEKRLIAEIARCNSEIRQLKKEIELLERMRVKLRKDSKKKPRAAS